MSCESLNVRLGLVRFNGCQDASGWLLSWLAGGPTCLHDTWGDRETRASACESRVSSSVVLSCLNVNFARIAIEVQDPLLGYC